MIFKSKKEIERCINEVEKASKEQKEKDNEKIYTIERLLTEGKKIQELTNEELLATSKSMSIKSLLCPQITTEISRRINNYE